MTTRARRVPLEERAARALVVLAEATCPLTLQEVAARCGDACTRGELWRPALARLVAEGVASMTGTNRKLYKLVRRVKSPCVGRCSLVRGASTPPADVCSGCGRTVTEVAYWRDMTPAEQESVVLLAAGRLKNASCDNP